jgi:esterase
MLHGIYGRGRNWQAIARALVSRRPEYACWLVDLPYHGDSPAARHGDGVVGLAADLDDWLRAEGVRPDATPEVKPPSGSAWDMLQVVRGMPARFESRDEATEAIVAGGFSLGVAQWMATNLARDGEGFLWRLDFDRMERLLHDFFAADLWPVVEDAGSPHVLHFLKATRSSAMSDAAASRVRALQGPRVQFHEREGGHWIHAETPDVVTDLLAEHLP